MEFIEKIFNFGTMVIGLVLSTIIIFMGGQDALLKAVFIAMTIDYITGVVRGFRFNELSSRVGFNGILRKGIMIMVIVFAVALDDALTLTSDAINARTMILLFYIGNEGRSIFENCEALGVPIPKGIKDFIEKLKKY